MNIYAQKGTKVRFLNFNGQEWEREKAATVFDIETEYTVDRTDVGGWSSDVYFEEVAGPWNTVMFLEVGEELPDYIKRARGIPVEEKEVPEEKKYVPNVVKIEHHQNVAGQAADTNCTVEQYREASECDTDEEFNDYLCGGDYWAYSVQVDGVEVARYGDHYHDKGADKAEGFVDALVYVYKEINYTFKQVADQE